MLNTVLLLKRQLVVFGVYGGLDPSEVKIWLTGVWFWGVVVFSMFKLDGVAASGICFVNSYVKWATRMQVTEVLYICYFSWQQLELDHMDLVS